MSIFMDYLQQEAAKEKGAVSKEEWLRKTAKNAAKCTFATHVGKFVHPSADVKVLVKPNTVQDSPYVLTSAVRCPVDISTGASYLGAAKLLLLPLENGRTVYENFFDDSDFIKMEMQNLQADYQEIRRLILQAVQPDGCDVSDERLRQVYFPLKEDSYHLLTVLPPSSVMMELRKRLRDMENIKKMAKDKESESYGQPYAEVYDLTEGSFGGTKPQNISFLNNAAGGRTCLLPSNPPVLRARTVTKPRYDFFDTLWIRNFQIFFRQLHDVYTCKVNNRISRCRARNIEDTIIDQVVLNVYALRQVEPGWTDADNNYLPKDQKIWLDQKYDVIRAQEEEWQESIDKAFARWIMKSYERIMGKEKVQLGDGEFKALKHRIHTAIRETV